MPIVSSFVTSIISCFFIIFFGMHLPLFAFIEIVFLWAAILATIIYFYKINRIASYLLIPYFPSKNFILIFGKKSKTTVAFYSDKVIYN